MCVYASRKLRMKQWRTKDEWVDGKEKEFMVLMGGRDITGYVALSRSSSELKKNSNPKYNSDPKSSARSPTQDTERPSN